MNRYQTGFRDEKLKSTFLKYIVVQGLYSNEAVDHLGKEYSTLLSIEIQDPSINWKETMKKWINEIEHYTSSIQTKLSPSDKFLRSALNQFKDPQLSVKPSDLQSIVNRLDFDHNLDDDKIWNQILNGGNQPMLSGELTRILYKQQLLNDIYRHNIDIENGSVLLNPTENRLLDFIKWAHRNQRHALLRKLFGNKIEPTICRLCFIEANIRNIAYSTMKRIEEVDEIRNIPFIDKINKCCPENIQIYPADGYPQYICRQCQYLLEKCYQFKILCENTAKKLSTYDLISSNMIDLKSISNILTDCDSLHANDSIESTCKIEIIDDWNENQLNGNTTIEIQPFNPPPIGRFNCKECGIDCINSLILRHHQRSHSKISLYHCDICGKNFQQFHQIKYHMLKHSDDRSFICEVCGKTFKCKTTLNSHRDIHSSDKRFICSHCPYRSFKGSCMRKHILTHTDDFPFKCGECDNAYRTNSNLRKHERCFHRQERTNKCTICEKGFFDRRTLRAHIRSHTGQQPYQCVVCRHSYSTYIGLTAHLKRNHVDVQVPLERTFSDLLK